MAGCTICGRRVGLTGTAWICLGLWVVWGVERSKGTRGPTCGVVAARVRDSNSAYGATTLAPVMTGLSRPLYQSRAATDGRVKPGHDGEGHDGGQLVGLK